ncbi:hypothetical protein RCH18_000885 [Flavobacterium sp. PL11]|jgi:hypothetical protein|uniref:hypothetical protein n=1 Tax=Flavobacterium sp. PL11 TaxID=3071717 RepID=UPI002DF803D1|nr:hypothetical protein [Flavobacterium sp. PL11]
MRAQYIILLCIFFVYGIVSSQSKSNITPPKNTVKIIIKNSSDKISNFNLIAQTIIDNDFSIDKKDNEFFIIETAPKLSNDKTSTYILKLVAKDNLIVLTGFAKSRINSNFANIPEEYEKIINKGMKGSIFKDQFNSMFSFAKLFADNELEFVVN